MKWNQVWLLKTWVILTCICHVKPSVAAPAPGGGSDASEIVGKITKGFTSLLRMGSKKSESEAADLGQFQRSSSGGESSYGSYHANEYKGLRQPLLHEEYLLEEQRAQAAAPEAKAKIEEEAARNKASVAAPAVVKTRGGGSRQELGPVVYDGSPFDSEGFLRALSHGRNGPGGGLH